MVTDEEIMEILHEILVRLEKITTMLEEIKDQISEKKVAEGERREKRQYIIEELMEKMREKGFLSLSKDIPQWRGKEEIIRKLKRLGAVELDAGRDVYIFHPKSYEEFKSLLDRVTVGDPMGAAEKIGKYKEVFLNMVSSGLLYFDAKSKKWAIMK